MRQSRRAFLRTAVGLTGVSVAGGLAGCARSAQLLDDAGNGNDDTAPPPDASDLGLQPGMTIGIGSTAVAGLVSKSEVDPDQPGGGRLVTIEAVDPGDEVTLSWRRTVTHERSPTVTVGGGEATPTAAVETVAETGTITASGLAASHAAFLPMYWRPGDHRTDTSAIWLSQEAYQELKESGQTPWSRDVLTRISRVGVEAVSQIDRRVADQICAGAAEVDEVVLQVDSDTGTVELAVDGAATTVSAIEAYDSFGNAYTIIDDEQNPLVAAFTYDAVSVGFTGFDTALWTLIKTVFSGYQVVSIRSP